MLRNGPPRLLLYLGIAGLLVSAIALGYGWKMVEAANLLLYASAALALGWFVFRAVLVKLWRARHIRILREVRLLREAAARTSTHSH